MGLLRKKKPLASYFQLNSQNFDEQLFSEAIFGQTMFADKNLISCNNLLENKEIKSFILEKIEKISSSPNLFIFREAELLAGEIKVFKKHADKVELFDTEADTNTNKNTAFNIFELTDSFGRRDRKQTWILFCKAILNGMEAEEILWKFVWMIKNMMLVKRSEELRDRSIKDLKISPFVLNKAKSFSNNFKDVELIWLYENLIDIYHQSRRGATDVETSLEALVMGI